MPTLRYRYRSWPASRVRAFLTFFFSNEEIFWKFKTTAPSEILILPSEQVKFKPLMTRQVFMQIYVVKCKVCKL